MTKQITSHPPLEGVDSAKAEDGGGQIKMLKPEHIKKGMILTIDGNILGIGGWIIFENDQKVKVEEVLREPARWSNAFNMWMPEKITGIKLDRHYGIWFLNTFKETKSICR